MNNSLIWLRKNLFNTWYNTILTVLSLLFIYWLLSGLINWLLTQAQWRVLTANIRLFFVGRYPARIIWRVWTSLGIIVGLGAISWSILRSHSRFAFLKSWLAPIWLLGYFLIYWLLTGGFFLRPTVRLDSLSGLILTLFVAITSILLCFPFGVLLALGRQSKLPAIRWLSTAYIEILRGLPLIGILFMAQVMLPLILPPNVRPDRVVRGIAGYTLFTAAYVAENVRGGLQSIPRGQTEAAKALGLNTPLMLLLVILPQAIKAVIPSTVGQFISLFKDTSLLALVGLTDLLGISQSILANPKYLGRYAEVYLFIAAIYWFFCYSMSIASRRLERELNVNR
jgi:general L-amino acid transport system permease protein